MNENYYSAIVLLDPTIFSTTKVYLWHIFKSIGIKSVNPLIKKTINRKTTFESFDVIFKQYRKKPIFSRISDQHLTYYINSIFSIEDNHHKLNYSKDWEAKIYESAGIKDVEIWKISLLEPLL